MAETIDEATIRFAIRYARFIETRAPAFDTWQHHPRLSLRNLEWLCEQIIQNDTHPIDKKSRWLGFVQGCLSMRGMIDVDEERDYTRTFMHAAYEAEGIEIPVTVQRD